MNAFLVRATSPEGQVSYVCYVAPGLTPDRSKATQFTNRVAASHACISARWGEPHAFWNSERASAGAHEKLRRGWSFEVEG